MNKKELIVTDTIWYRIYKFYRKIFSKKNNILTQNDKKNNLSNADEITEYFNIYINKMNEKLKLIKKHILDINEKNLI